MDIELKVDGEIERYFNVTAVAENVWQSPGDRFVIYDEMKERVYLARTVDELRDLVSLDVYREVCDAIGETPIIDVDPDLD